MVLRRFCLLVLPLLILPCLTTGAYADTFAIGSAGPFAVLGEAGVTNTGPSVIHGNVAGSVGTPAVTGFPPGIVVPPGVLIAGGASASVFNDATTAYNAAQGILGGISLTGQDLGGLTLTAGTYSFATSAFLSTGILTLDAQGSNTAQWTFQIGTTLITLSGTSVQVINAGAPGAFNGGITWAVGSASTLGTTTTFLGTIISNTGQDALLTGATIGCGRVISLHASVTLDSNIVDNGCVVTAGTGGTGGTITGAPGPTPVPEPGSIILLGSGLVGIAGTLRRKLKR